MLLRLYSETALLVKDVAFQAGINLILGKYSEDRTKGKGVNGIGKSTLVRLIAYLFLSDKAEKLFAESKYDFLRSEDHSISLDLQIGSEQYSLRREFKKKDKAFFGTARKTLTEYTRPELKEILSNKFFPIYDHEIFFEGSRFGTLMHFFIKDDLQSIQRIDPLEFLPYNASKAELAIYNYFLLNLPTKNLINFREISEEYNKYQSTLKTLEQKVESDTGKKIAHLKSEKIKLEDRITSLERSLKDFKFLPNYQDIEDRLLTLTKEIAEKLNAHHILSQKLNKIRESYQRSLELDTKKVQQVYDEIVAGFGEYVKKTLDEVQQFKRQLLENRNKFLVRKEKELVTASDDILKEVSALEQSRSPLYRVLQEKGALESITNTYEQLVQERTTLEKTIQILKQIEDIQIILSDLDVKLSQSKKSISDELHQLDERINGLRSLFLRILQEAILLDNADKPAYFDIEQISTKNRSQLPFRIKVEIPKADALGQSRLKIVAYDLLVFFSNVEHERQFPDFLIHDGVFHGIARETVVNILNYIYHRSLLSPTFQYITTFNEDELSTDESKEALVGKLEFDIEKTLIAKFEDTDSRMIFGRAFS